jgi:hypothetical protein
MMSIYGGEPCPRYIKDLREQLRILKKADGRHGGLLDLPMDDTQAFKQWYHSGRWSGSHPWEIVFGHPHGIMLAPHHNEQGDDWQYALWVDSLGWYLSAALMALALAARQVPFELHRSEKLLAALKGEDDVEVGPFLGFEGISLEELKETSPDAISHICWDPIPQILPISPEQKKRLAEVLKKAV